MPPEERGHRAERRRRLGADLRRAEGEVHARQLRAAFPLEAPLDQGTRIRAGQPDAQHLPGPALPHDLEQQRVLGIGDHEEVQLDPPLAQAEAAKGVKDGNGRPAPVDEEGQGDRFRRDERERAAVVDPVPTQPETDAPRDAARPLAGCCMRSPSRPPTPSSTSA